MSLAVESQSSTTSDFINLLRSEIEQGLLNQTLAILEPKINEMLYRNVFNCSEAIDYLKISDSTLRRLIRDKEIPYFRLRGTILFRQWELDDFISKQMIRKGE